jgi:hypothetical protein
MRAQLSRWKGGQQGIPPATKSSQNTARAIAHVYTVIFLLEAFPRQST